MSEVTADYFRKPTPRTHPRDVEGEAFTSTEAPTRPLALQRQREIPSDIDERNDIQDVDTERMLPPSRSPTTTNTTTNNTSAPTPTVSQLPAPIRRINFGTIESRQQLMRELNGTIPLNEFNLPRFIYRADLLDYTALATLSQLAIAVAQHQHQTQPQDAAPANTATGLFGQLHSNGYASLPTSHMTVGDAERQIKELLDVATIFLDYHHGYPTLKNGQPLWAKLDWEGTDAFHAFVRYLETPGVRTLQSINSWPGDVLTEWYHLNTWAYRAQAYDMFRQAHHDRMRAHRIMHTEDSHYIAAEAAFSKLNKTLSAIPEDKLAELEPQVIVTMMEKLARIQRASVGLRGLDGSETPKPQPMSVEVQMRQIASNDGALKPADDGFDTFTLLENADALKAAQELIVKVHGGK